MANRHLVEAGFEPSVDVRNWKDKGLDEAPTNKPMWQWQAEKRAEAIIEDYRPKHQSQYRNLQNLNPNQAMKEIIALALVSNTFKFAQKPFYFLF